MAFHIEVLDEPPLRLVEDSLGRFVFRRGRSTVCVEGKRSYPSWQDGANAALMHGLVVERDGSVRVLPGAKQWS